MTDVKEDAKIWLTLKLFYLSTQLIQSTRERYFFHTCLLVYLNDYLSFKNFKGRLSIAVNKLLFCLLEDSIHFVPTLSQVDLAMFGVPCGL